MERTIEDTHRNGWMSSEGWKKPRKEKKKT
jgi:hypothetical protein